MPVTFRHWPNDAPKYNKTPNPRKRSTFLYGIAWHLFSQEISLLNEMLFILCLKNWKTQLKYLKAHSIQSMPRKWKLKEIK